MKKFYAYLAIFFVCGAASAQAENLSVNGLQLGMPESELTTKYKGFNCSGNEASRTCFYSIGGENKEIYLDYFVNTWMVKLNNDQVGYALMTITNNVYERLLAAFKEKYGAPTSEKTEEIQNKMGAVFQNNVSQWVKGKERLTIKKYGSKLDMMSLVLASEDFLETERNSSKGQAKSDAGKI